MSSERRQLAALGANDISGGLSAADGKASTLRHIQRTVYFAVGRIQRELAGLDRHLFVYISQQLQRAAFVRIGLRRCKCVRKINIARCLAILDNCRRKVAAALGALVILVIARVLAHCHSDCKSI